MCAFLVSRRGSVLSIPSRFILAVLVPVFSGICFVPAVFSAPDTPAETPAEVTEQADAPKISEDAASPFLPLSSLMDQAAVVANRLSLRRQSLEYGEPDAEEKKRLEEEIRDLEADHIRLMGQFDRIATGVERKQQGREEDEKLDWREEVRKLIMPLVTELRRLTDQPRKMDALRKQIEELTIHRANLAKGLKNLSVLLNHAAAKPVDVEERLVSLKGEWEARKNRAENRLSIMEFQLAEMERKKGSVLESTQQFIRGFFKSRGRNILFAIISSLLVWLAFRLIHAKILIRSPFHQGENPGFPARLIDVLWQLGGWAGAAVAALAVLYLSGDWLLLSLAIILILAAAWTAKEGLPLFWRQIQLMLNLGMVREGERIEYCGVSWRVDSLSFYAVLENPCLRPSRIRVPLKELVPLISRPAHPSEPWFPSDTREWVILSDGTRGCVVSQTPEMVRLELRGGAVKTYSTADYLGMAPLNLSGGYRLKIPFGFDYTDQKTVTCEIPEKLKSFLADGLDAGGWTEKLRQLKVEVTSAAASAIELVIIADFTGDTAPRYNAIRRELTRLAIDACTANNWNIPFNQLVVHMPAGTGENQIS